MSRLIVREQAREDVETIALRIMPDNVAAALRFIDAAEDAFTLLAEHPGAGPRLDPAHPADATLRFWPITRFRNYLVIYRPLSDGVDVVRVLHGAATCCAPWTSVAASRSRGVTLRRDLVGTRAVCV